MKLGIRVNERTPKTIDLDFEGYCSEDELPPSNHDCPGIYVVYAGECKSEEKCSLRKILYIGRSGDVAGRPNSSHHKYKDWHKELNYNESLLFSFADTDDEKRAEAALIFEMKPICNDTGKDGFHYPDTKIKTSGANEYLIKLFTVYNTDND